MKTTEKQKTRGQVKAVEIDVRFVKLRQYHDFQMSTTCYGVGGFKPDADCEHNREIKAFEAFFYDKLEPKWMEPIPGWIRVKAYELLIYGHYGIISHPASWAKFKCITYTSGATLLNAAVYIASKLFPQSYEYITYCMLTAFNIPAIAYICNIYYKGRQDEKAIEAQRDHYKDKSMEFILRDAYTLKVDGIEKHYTPDVIEGAQTGAQESNQIS